MNSEPSDLIARIRTKQARIGIIGLGYVGLPLAVEFARAGFDVTGFDVDAAKNKQINDGRSYIPDVPDADLAAVVTAGRLRATADMGRLGAMDAIDICVPTPLRKTKDPDLSYIVKAVEAVAASLRPGQLVILESTTYPGTTEEVVQPMLEAGGLKADVDFLLAFSPERVDPGNAQHTTRTIPKVVGGLGRRGATSTSSSCRPSSTVGFLEPTWICSGEWRRSSTAVSNQCRAANANGPKISRARCWKSPDVKGARCSRKPPDAAGIRTRRARSPRQIRGPDPGGACADRRDADLRGVTTRV